MAIKIFCNICDKTMGSISACDIRSLKDFAQKTGEVCKSCIKMEEDLKAFALKQKGIVTTKCDRLMTEYVGKLKREIAKLAKKGVENGSERTDG